MSLQVPQRVHITPVGHEYDRVVEPAKEFRADKVVLIGHTENDEKGEEYWEKAVESFKQEDTEYAIRQCDIFDLYDSLGTIAEVISTHAEDDVYVNVASGSKITAIAGMIASMVLDATAYYVRVRRYEEVPKEIEQVTELPKYPIDSPDPEQIAVLEYIRRETFHEGPPTKGEVIHFSEQAGLPYVRESVAGKGKYRLLDTNIVEPLKDRNYITESKSGRNKVISITEEGQAALEAFRWLVGEAVNWDEILDHGGEESSESEDRS